ncbi:MAG: pepsin/retropepsin-like aspartic protease family protein [Brevundimonas sp.]|uniref:pepsin/retropepsin-like aspartic protease family protein n=1 Tax=Brevundimonas sp. TaxID=1871086 RepID=UPI0026075499|nr:pepsin/retropepsin-like aspartic protease family protein [Brevundimonas sp.]MDI6624306.1 pepsin/retropepsin-like aspartic protease family protein [Brevundimonas sp.]MDQ7812520.1 pepsin/retropepsin-like aspartic protease family protein [Brevundimonas sp.]
MNRRNLLFRAAGLAAVVGGAWWARETLFWPAPDLAFAEEGATPWLPYARRANVPTVKVRVEGRDIIALIDTGAQYSVIDRRLVETLPAQRRSLFDMPLVAYGVGGGSQMGRGTTVEVSLPGLTIGELRAAILDLGPLASAGGLNTPLILGRDVLEHLVLALDPARRHVRLISRDSFVRPPDLASTVVRSSGGGLVVEITVEGVVVNAVVDTGASSLLALDSETARAVGLMDGRAQTSATSLVLGGAARAAILEARTVTFADHLYRRVQVGVFEQPPLPNFPGALVGMEAFAGRRVAIDLGAGTLHVSQPLDLTVN